MPPVDSYLEQLIMMKGSDLHISSNRPPMIRIHGVMEKMDPTELSMEAIKNLLKDILPKKALDANKWDDVDFAYSLKGIHRFRVNVFLDKLGVGAVFRHIPSILPTFEQIALEEGAKRLCDLKKGLVLVTGPTGSGKSTTLAAMIDHINQTRAYHIITIEDPIEFVYEPLKSLVHQRELETHTQSFGDSLRAALRQDPDVILVGEMRDLITTKLAIEAAETGHVVFATLHTNTASSTITRIINQFGEEEQELIRAMLSENLKGVICQTLLKREDREGRIAAREIMLYTVAGANLIREKKVHQLQSVIDSNQEMGMISLNASLTNLVSQDIISPQTAWEKTIDHKDLASRFQRLGVRVEGMKDVG